MICFYKNTFTLLCLHNAVEQFPFVSEVTLLLLYLLYETSQKNQRLYPYALIFGNGFIITP